MTNWLRSRDGLVAGVFEGIAKYYGINPIVLRLGWICSVLFFGFGLLLYIVLAVLMPLENRIKNYENPMILGVCARISRKWGYELVVVRVLFFGAFLASCGIMLLVYLIMNFLITDRVLPYKNYYYSKY